MRLVYFMANVKMSEFQAYQTETDMSPSKRLDTTMNNVSPKKTDNKTSESTQLKNQSVKTTTHYSIKNTIESEESVSPGMRFRKTRLAS